MSVFKSLNQQVEINQEIDLSSEKLRSFNRFDKMPSFIREYIEYIYSIGYSPNTIQRYIYDFCDFFLFAKREGNVLIDSAYIAVADFCELEKSAIERYVSYLKIEVENEPRTISRKLSALQSLFTYLVTKEYTTINPVVGVRRPKSGKRNPKYLTSTEFNKLLEIVLSDYALTIRQKKYHKILVTRDYTVIFILIKLGLRVSELANLTLGQFDFERKIALLTGKGNKERAIPLTNEVIEVVERYLLSLPEEARPKEHFDHLIIGYNFPNQVYTRNVSTNGLQQMISKHVKRAKKHFLSLKGKNTSAHTLRHTFATELVNNSIDLITIQQLLGHESVATTQVYTHVHEDFKRKALESLR
ncbi:tyrosine-type recombinase/integrase [Alkalicoccobacillus gibsonii]|uniref:tyrosine-type recombinase/integrase n=1 Tax=Alkalicoccobacillus gibsonii TaxID=79881 RepID=UPI003F7CBA9E